MKFDKKQMQILKREKPDTKDCDMCDGLGYRFIKVEREVTEDYHRSAGVYYEKNKVKCRFCKGNK